MTHCNKLIWVITTILILLISLISVTVNVKADNNTEDDLIFIHHSCGSNWLSNSLHDALIDKDYIDERNDITYNIDLSPDSSRPDSLSPTPGHKTNMHHWILWFNDYLNGVISHGCNNGINKIIMFKSCYPASNIESDGNEPGDPFASSKTITNYKAVFRHPNGPGHTYSHNNYIYKSLEDIFAENPDILFIPVTAPPRHYAPSDATNDAQAHRARQFNNWLKNEWLNNYNSANPDLHNVAVFDWFDILSYPDSHSSHPNRLKSEYGGDGGNSHPNSDANYYSTQIFALNPNSFLDNSWTAFFDGTINNPPYMPSNPNPSNNAIDHDIDVDLSWSGGDPDPGDTVVYDIYFGSTDNPPRVKQDHPTNSYDPGTLEEGTKYYWKIISEDNHGDTNPGDLWSFTTQDDSTYYTLSVSKQGSGSVSPMGGSYAEDTVVDLVATPSVGWSFDQWLGDDIEGSTDPSESIVMNNDKSVTAVFIDSRQGVSISYNQFNMKKLNVDIKNLESNSLSNLEWSVRINGGLLDLVNVSSSGIISNIDTEASVEISSENFSLGLGFVDIITEVKSGEIIYKSEKQGILVGTIILVI